MIIMRGTRALLVATLALMITRVEVRTEDQPQVNLRGTYKVVPFFSRTRIAASLRRITVLSPTGRLLWWTTALGLPRTAR